MVGVCRSGGSFCRDVNADEARQPAGDDGELPFNAHGASLLSQTHAPAVKHDKPGRGKINSRERPGFSDTAVVCGIQSMLPLNEVSWLRVL